MRLGLDAVETDDAGCADLDEPTELDEKSSGSVEEAANLARVAFKNLLNSSASTPDCAMIRTSTRWE
jgi:hypothetical protein